MNQFEEEQLSLKYKKEKNFVCYFKKSISIIFVQRLVVSF